MTNHSLKSRLDQLEQSIAQKAHEEFMRHWAAVLNALVCPIKKHAPDWNLTARISNRMVEIVWPNRKAPSKWQGAGANHRFGAEDRLSRREIAAALCFPTLKREDISEFHDQICSALHQALEELLEDASLRDIIEQEYRASLDVILDCIRPEQAGAGQ